MPLLEKNLSNSEGLFWIAGAFICMIVGLFIFVINPLGVVFTIIGLCAFGIGYHHTNPFSGLTLRHWSIALGLYLVLAIVLIAVGLNLKG